MIITLIGHRGAGKSTLLEQLRQKKPQWGPFFDLDQVIQETHGQSITQLFQDPQAFRVLERQAFQNILDQHASATICVGGGFPHGDLLKQSHPIWVRRRTDLEPRYFLDRPSLFGPDQRAAHRQELQRREQFYRDHAAEIFFWDEGFTQAIFDQKIPGFWTLNENQLNNPPLLYDLKQFHGLEFRTDLISYPVLNRALEQIKTRGMKTKLLLALRGPRPSSLLDVYDLAFRFGMMVDWPLEWGWPPQNFQILSWHQDSIPPPVSDPNIDPQMIKWSPLCSDWSDFAQGLAWHEQDPQHRVFLPRSPQGRWRWWRLHCLQQQQLGFVDMGADQVGDQPHAQELLNLAPHKNFAAILGWPVDHSLTPSFHHEFFAQHGLKALRIPLTEADVEQGALNTLQRLGLRWAAVTSPLKQIVAKQLNSPVAVNTLAWSESLGKFLGTSTDDLGWAALSANVDPQQQLVLWGGQGIKEALLPQHPHVIQVSARQGDDKLPQANTQPSVLLWAVPAQFDQVQFPQQKISQVIDLNYTAHSLGLAWAQQQALPYTSGLKMFQTQALGQQEFWQKHRNEVTP